MTLTDIIAKGCRGSGTGAVVMAGLNRTTLTTVNCLSSQENVSDSLLGATNSDGKY